MMDSCKNCKKGWVFEFVMNIVGSVIIFVSKCLIITILLWGMRSRIDIERHEPLRAECITTRDDGSCETHKIVIYD